MFPKKKIEIIPTKTTAAEVLASGYADFHVKVPIDAYEQASSLMWDRMHNSPDYEMLFDDPAENPPTESELKARLAMFWALFCDIPMGAYEHFRLLAEYDEAHSGGQYLGDFVGAQLLNDENRILRHFTTEQIRQMKTVVDANLEASEAYDRTCELAEEQARQKRERRKAKKAA